MELIIFVGLQGSGKTTFYQEHFAATHQHISMDMLQNIKHPRQRQMVLLEAALQAGQSVVVDNTNPTIADREPLIRLGRLYGTSLTGYYFDANVRLCLERNRQRVGKARVPDVAIYATAKKLVSPTRTEGFDKMYRVSFDGIVTGYTD